ncbi:hypothetical protein GTA08_BOTSDO04686 [Neofusicoccum parvum]|uniref:Uncharacterized protein n=1 Tax=Neofusicoccum parvum TaxID=310453 RepID=A0ACB5RV38_9PEZI|nr:hypothetical protein GTA08_BOTSDO04686 [Neofusicoccum parvum]
MGGCLLSVSCTVAIIVLLPYLDDQPLSKWKWVMGPNTFISTLITIAKTSMLLPVAECLSQLKWRHFWLKSRPLAEIEAFDEASRGPWGAFVFPWKTKLKSWIALMGALVMVGALTMEPLAQQIVSFETKTRMPPLNELKGSNKSGIYVAQAYNTESSPEIQDEPFEAAQVIQGAFFDGVFDVTRLMASSCANGNCTWPDFLSLGVCSKCEDITDASTHIDNNCTSPHDNTCVVRHFDGLSERYNTSYNVTMYNQTGNHLALGASWYANNVSDSNEYSDTGLMTKFVLGRFDKYWRPTDNDRDGKPDYIRGTPEITECRINWCAKLYQNFSYHNTTDSYMPYNYSRWDLPLTRQEVSSQSETVVYTLDFAQTAQRYPSLNLTPSGLDRVYDDTFGAPQPGGGRFFEVGKNDFLVTSYFFGDMLAFALLDLPYTPATKFEQIFGRAFLHRLSVPVAFAAVADGITSQVQMAVDARWGRQRYFVEAQAVVAETYVKIRKRWFIVPAVLVLLSVVFLVVTLMASGMNDAPSWKSGTLPLLFHGLDGWGEFDDEEGKMMQARAKGMRTKLKRNNEGMIKFLKV